LSRSDPDGKFAEDDFLPFLLYMDNFNRRYVPVVLFLLLPCTTVSTDRPAAIAPDRMSLIPAGTFRMGGTGGGDDELPIHEVTLDAFSVDRFEVTVAEFRAFRSDYQPSEYSGCESCPATNVSWEEAAAYCESKDKRLPSEAEWERVCRGPNAWDYPWGIEPDTARARYGLDWKSGSVPVGSYEPNPLGVFDLGGKSRNGWMTSMQATITNAHPSAIRQDRILAGFGLQEVEPGTGPGSTSGARTGEERARTSEAILSDFAV
jgi:formylglycine-generating enzyme required for sulfatase activity